MSDQLKPSETSKGHHVDRTQRLLEGPILTTLISLAVPTVALMTFQAIVQAVEGYFIGFLGSEALAGISLSFPFVMLMTTMSAGAFGGGVSSGVARALGSGRPDDAGRIAGTALTMSLVFGTAFTAILLLFGRQIYSSLGASPQTLDSALAYSNILFLGAIPFWLFQAAASSLRGSGNTAYPAIVGALGGILTLAVSPLLIFGFGPIPGLQLAGAAWAIVAYNLISAILLLRAVADKSNPFRFEWRYLRPEVSVVATILRVAIPSSVNTLTSNLTFLALTAFVAPFGTSALAGYGMSGRLEFLLIPIVFGVGSALVPLISANAGAGRFDRVRQATRTGFFLGCGAGSIVGFTAAVIPDAWIGLFTSDPDVLQTGRSYLRIVGPFYTAFGGGLALFFASQGIGRVMQSVVAGFTRLTIAAIGGYMVTRQTGSGIESLYTVMAIGLAAYGASMVAVRRRELFSSDRAKKVASAVPPVEMEFATEA